MVGVHEMVPEEVPLLFTLMASLEPGVLVVFIKKGCPGELTLKFITSPALILIGGSFPENAPDNI